MEKPDRMKKRGCDCAGWLVSMQQIIDAQTFHHLRGAIYTGFEFVFCPWCGSRLIEDTESTSISDMIRAIEAI